MLGLVAGDVAGVLVLGAPAAPEAIGALGGGVAGVVGVEGMPLLAAGGVTGTDGAADPAAIATLLGGVDITAGAVDAGVALAIGRLGGALGS